MKIRLALAAAAGLVTVTAGAAYAAGPPYDVSVGGSAAYDPSHPVVATSTGGVAISVLNDASVVVNMSCTSLELAGTATSGQGINPIFVFTSSTWTGCVIAGGPAPVTQLSTWNFVGTGTNATAGSETVGGYISNVVGTAANGACSITFEGHLQTSFDESAQDLLVNETGYTGNLELTSVTGCFGQLQVGNPANVVAALDVASTNGVIDLS